MISKYSDVEAPSSPPLPLGITGDDWRGLASPDQALGKMPIIRVGPGETHPAAGLQWPAPAQPAHSIAAQAARGPRSAPALAALGWGPGRALWAKGRGQ